MASAVFFKNKIIISGGKVNVAHGSKITEIIDLPITNANLPIKPRRGGDLNYVRNESWQGMGIVEIKGQPKLVMFSNSNLPIEMWNEKEEIWEVSQDLHFPGGNPCTYGYFGYCFNDQLTI